MRNRPLLFASLALLALAGCVRQPLVERVAEHPLAGVWLNLDLEITYDYGTDSARVWYVAPGRWTDSLKILPIRTHFRPDSSYTSDHYRPDSSFWFSAEGRLEVRADSVVLVQSRPAAGLYPFAYSVEGDTVSFSGLVDWDEDGTWDDRYVGRQVRQPGR